MIPARGESCEPFDGHSPEKSCSVNSLHLLTQVHIRGDCVLLEVVEEPARHSAAPGQEAGGERTPRVHRGRLVNERRGRH